MYRPGLGAQGKRQRADFAMVGKREEEGL